MYVQESNLRGLCPDTSVIILIDSYKNASFTMCLVSFKLIQLLLYEIIFLGEVSFVDTSQVNVTSPFLHDDLIFVNVGFPETKFKI